MKKTRFTEQQIVFALWLDQHKAAGQCPDAIAQALKETVSRNEVAERTPFRRACQKCGHPVRWEANCEICDYCGFSNCG